MGKEESVELKLRNIVDSGRPKTLVVNGKKHYVSKDKIKRARIAEEKAGGFLPLIPIILGAIAAAGSVAGGAAGISRAVNKKKAEDAALAEQRRHNQQMEAAARGKGLDYDDYEEDEEYGEGIGEDIKNFAVGAYNDTKSAIKDFVKKVPPKVGEQGKKVLKKTLYHLADAISIKKQGEGLYLSPYRF